MNRQQNQFKRMTGNFGGMLIGKTNPNVKVLIVFLLTVVPMIVINMLIRTEYIPGVSGDSALYGNWQPLLPISYGIMWVQSLIIWAGGLLVVSILRAYKPSLGLQKDLYISITGYSFALIGFLLMYPNGWWRIVLAFVYAFLSSSMVRLFVVIKTLQVQAQKAREMMNQFQKGPLNQQFNKSFNQNIEEEMIKNLDQQLRNQGIDIDTLNEQFGDQLKPDNPNNTIEVTSQPLTEEEKKESESEQNNSQEDKNLDEK